MPLPCRVLCLVKTNQDWQTTGMDEAEEFAELERAAESWVKATKPDPSRIEELWNFYYHKDDPYRTVLNGHIVLEDFLNQILRESFRKPDGLLDFSFAKKLALLLRVWRTSWSLYVLKIRCSSWRRSSDQNTRLECAHSTYLLSLSF